MDANSGKPWSKMDISDLRNEIAHGRTVAQTASFLCRDEDEVREKMKELGLVERPRKEKPRRSEVGEELFEGTVSITHPRKLVFGFLVGVRLSARGHDF